MSHTAWPIQPPMPRKLGSPFAAAWSFVVACPLCLGERLVLIYRDEFNALEELAGEDALRERLEALRRDRPLSRCPACIVRRGGENA